MIKNNKDDLYFEKNTDWISPPNFIKKCKNCLIEPTILSLRKKEENSLAPEYQSVMLLGMKIICNKCKKFLSENHSLTRNTLHPDDTTIILIITKWNEIN